MKCLVVVAHPDDEAIWMGGTILTYPSWEWHIVSLTRADDPDRVPRFEQAAAEFGARSFISDLDDSSPTLAPLSENLEEIKSRISAAISHIQAVVRNAAETAVILSPSKNERLSERMASFDLIFTHGRNGEYGHERHRQVHQAVYEMIESGDLHGEPTYFAYDYHDGRCTPHPAEDTLQAIELSPDVFARKQHVVRDIYGFQPGSFEFDSAGHIEAFSEAGDAGMLRDCSSSRSKSELGDTTVSAEGD